MAPVWGDLSTTFLVHTVLITACSGQKFLKKIWKLKQIYTSIYLAIIICHKIFLPKKIDILFFFITRYSQMKTHCFVSLTPTRRKHSHIWTESQSAMSRTLRPWRPDTRPLFGLHHLWKGPEKLPMSPRILITGYSLSDQHILSQINPKYKRLILSELRRFEPILLKVLNLKTIFVNQAKSIYVHLNNTHK